MYKDPDKQREANRQWEQVKCRYCHKDLDNVPGKVKKQFCCDAHRKASKRLESGLSVDEPRTNGTKQPRTATSDKGITITTKGVTSKPGDVFEKTVYTGPKRGKDIKTFADLPPDVQKTIDTLSDDKAEHKRRTAIAVNYQHLFPGRFHSVGVI